MNDFQGLSVVGVKKDRMDLAKKKDSNREICGDGTILYLDYGNGHTNLHMWLICIELHTHTSTCKTGKIFKISVDCANGTISYGPCLFSWA